MLDDSSWSRLQGSQHRERRGGSAHPCLRVIDTNIAVQPDFPAFGAAICRHSNEGAPGQRARVASDQGSQRTAA